jgi:5'(3')-deoxyribonucleotidase
VLFFDQVCGFYLHYKDTQVPELVNKWKVKRLALERNTRHNDIQIVDHFFRHLASFLEDKRKDNAKMKTARSMRICRVDKLRYI